MADGAATIPAEELLAHAEWVKRLARALLSDEAEASDLAQEVMIAAVVKPPPAEVPVTSWLSGVARNLAKFRFRGAARRKRREEASVSDESVPSPESLVERAQAHQMVTRLVLELDEPLRSTLLLRFYEGLSSAEIATKLSLPAGTVRWRLKRGLDELRARLDADSGGSRRWAVVLAPWASAGKPATLAKGLLLMKATKIVGVVAIALVLAWLATGLFRGKAAPETNAISGGGASATGKRRGVEPPIALAMRETVAVRAPDPTGTLRLEGQVIDEQDRPVAGAEVALDASPARLTRSGLDGGFVFEKLIARDCRVEARTDEGHAGPVEMRLTGTSDPVILRIRRGGALEVEVRDAVSGQPVRDAVVELRSSLTWTARSDENGRARLAGIGAGWPTLHVAATGYARAALFLHTSGDPQKAQRQIVALSRGAPVAGRVLDADNHPVAGARVVAAATAEPFPVIDDVRDAVVTAADGSFTIDALAAGSFRFLASHPDFGPGTTAPIVLDGEHPQRSIEIRLGRGAALSGLVTDGSGQPVASALVRLVGRGSLAWRLSREAYSDGNGRFAMRGLPARAVELSARSGDASSDLARVDLSAGAERNVTLVLSVRGEISGTVVATDGREAPEARVSVEPEWSGGVGEREAWEVRGLSSILADGGGRFHFAGLPPGRYRVRAARPAASDEALYVAHAVAANTGDHDVQVVISADGRVRGRVAYKEGGAPDRFTIEIGGVRPEPFATPGGDFELEAPGGTQDAIVTGPSFARTTVKDVVIREGAITDLGTITVEKGRTVSGTVLDADGQPVPGATITGGLVLSGNGSELFIPSESIGAQVATSDAGGHYVLRGFGEQPIVVVAERSGVGRSPSVRIPRGPASVELDLPLAPTGALFGVATRDGAPLPETIVIANPRGARSSNFFVTTGSDGSYAFDRLSPGEYVVFPMLGGGGMKPKDMFYRAVTITAGERTQADLAARYGDASVAIKVLSDSGAPIPAALVFVVGGDAAATSSDAIRDGVGLPDSGAIVAAYNRTATGGTARVDGILPGTYRFCATPLPVDPNDPAAMDQVRFATDNLPQTCTTATLADGAQTVTLRAPKSH